MTDQKIIELFFARSQDAVTEIKQKYGTRLLLLSHNILGDLLDAEECVNDTLLAAWNAIPPTRPNPLLAWLCATVRNISMNRLRGKRAEKRGGGQICEAFDEFTDTFPDQGPWKQSLTAESWRGCWIGFYRAWQSGTGSCFWADILQASPSVNWRSFWV